MFAGSLLKNRDQVAIAVPEYKEERQDRTFRNDVRAIDVATVNEHVGTLGT